METEKLSDRIYRVAKYYLDGAVPDKKLQTLSRLLEETVNNFYGGVYSQLSVKDDVIHDLRKHTTEMESPYKEVFEAVVERIRGPKKANELPTPEQLDQCFKTIELADKVANVRRNHA